MFTSKLEVDRHVEQCLKNVKNDTERSLRCFAFAKLYYKVGDYEQARRYISSYLGVRNTSAEAHHLLGQILEKLGKIKAAYEAYQTSLHLDPKQNDLNIKLCELLASDEVAFNPNEAKYYCEKVQVIDPHNPIIYTLKEKLIAVETDDPKAICNLLLKEMEQNPVDLNLGIRLMRQLLDSNQIEEAYQHAIGIEEKLYKIPKPSANSLLKWYEIVSTVLNRYKNEKAENIPQEFWLNMIACLEKIAGLCLDEHGDYIKTPTECVAALFNFDQYLLIALEKLKDYADRKTLNEFRNHYRGQLCFHLTTFIYKQAKKNHVQYKECVYTTLPLLFISCHLRPAVYDDMWFGDGTPQNLIKRWHLEATFRCSQTGHMILNAVKKHGKGFILEKAHIYSNGLWREQLYKKVFATREHQSKMKSSFFVSSPEFLDVQIYMPEANEISDYTFKSQHLHPNNLHLYIWAGLNEQLAHFKCVSFDGLPYSARNLANCSAESLNVLDVEAFLYAAILTVQSHAETMRRSESDEERPLMPAAITERLGTDTQSRWLKAAYKLYKNEASSNLSEVRLTLIKGIEVVRCIGNHGLDMMLLVNLARTFVLKSKQQLKQSEIELIKARAELYWKVALPLLEKLKNGQIPPKSSSQRMFDYRCKELSRELVNDCIEEGKLFLGCQLVARNDYELALELFSTLKDPYASFYQADIYKTLAENEGRDNSNCNLQTEQEILLKKARDFLYLTLDRLRDPNIDRNHPLNARLATEIDHVEHLLSRLDFSNPNLRECDGMSDENGSINTSSHYATPFSSSRYERSISTIHNNSSILMNTLNGGSTTPYRSQRREEARPSPEKLDAQIRQLSMSIGQVPEQIKQQMGAVTLLSDSLRQLVADLKDLKQAFDDQKLDSLQNFHTITDMVYEMRKEIKELKKDAAANKTKNTQLTDEDLYPLDDEFAADYSIGSSLAVAPPTSAFSSASLYSNYTTPRLPPPPGALAYPPPNLYPAMYPSMAYYGGLGMPQPGGLPFGAEQQIAAELRAMNTLSQNTQSNYPLFPPSHLGQPPTSINSAIPPPTSSALPQFFKDLDNKPSMQSQHSQNASNASISFSTYAPIKSAPDSFPQNANNAPPPPTSLPITGYYPVPLMRSPPVNVVITASDPLPTGKVATSQPILSVTIPPQHLKGNMQSKSQPHNYQIQMPTVTTASTPSVLNQLPPSMLGQTSGSPTHDLLGKGFVSTLDKKSTGLGVQIEKSLSQSFNASGDGNRSNLSGSFEEHDPCPDFKPIVPLPDQVPVSTGEENEEVLFSERAKLFRFQNKEWKERGVGILKILKSKETGKIRILMRRDQVHKICANHFLTADMKLTPMPNNDKAYFWVAYDYADEQVVFEKLCARFKTIDEACKFYRAFEEAKLALPQTDENVGDGPKVVPIQTTTKVETTTPSSTPSLGGFTFVNTPAFKTNDLYQTPTKEVAKSEPPKSSPFAGFTFSSNKSSTPVITFGAQSTPKEATVTPFKQQSILEITKTPTTPKEAVQLQPTPQSPEVDASEFVPTAEYKPVVPLPDLVDHKTGEENAVVLYDQRAKLLRFDAATKEWKERGVGNIKILKEEEIIRLVMRREQVHKVCCNHQLLKPTTFSKLPQSPKAISWGANDFSEGVWKAEVFALRFKNEELADQFLKAVTDAQALLNDNNNLSQKQSQMKTEKLVKEDKEEQQQQPTVKVTKVEVVTPPKQQSDWGEKFKPKSGSWACKTCYIVNDGKRNYCEACDTPKNDTVPKKDAEKGTTSFSFGVLKPEQGFLFGTQKPTSEPAVQGFGDAFKKKEGNWDCTSCMVSNKPDTLYCVCCESPKDCTVPPKEPSKGINLDTGGMKFNFGIPKGTTITPVQSTPAATTSSSVPSFVFSSSGFNFSVKASEPAEAPGAEKETSTAPFVFKPVQPKEKADVKSEDTESKVKYIFGSPQKYAFDFTPRSPRRQSGGQTGEGDESDGSYVEEESDNIYFKPVIPLPDKVEVKTGEEDEEELYKQRAKLFRFVSGEWKERGIGDIKVLKGKLDGKLRILMRRDQVLKICLNHALSQDIKYIPKDDKTWLFFAADFSDGELARHQFCLRFKTPAIANEFKSAVDTAVKNLQGASEPTETKVTLQTEPTTTSNTASSTEIDSDVEFISETVVTKEEEEEAKRLLLPPKFLAYRQLPDCGCSQCRKDDEYLNETSDSQYLGTPSSSTDNSSTALGASSDVSKTPSVISFLQDTPPLKIDDGKSVSEDAKTVKTSGSNETLKGLLLKPSVFGGFEEKKATKSDSEISTVGSFTEDDTTRSKSDTNATFKTFSFSTGSNSSGSTSGSSIFSMPSTLGNSFSFGQNATSIFGNNSKIPLTTTGSTPIFGVSKSTSIFDVPKTTTFGDAGKTSAESTSIFGSKSSATHIFGGGFGTKTEAPVVLTADPSLSFASLAGSAPSKPAFQTKETKGSADNPFDFLGAGAPVFGSARKPTAKKNGDDTGEDGEGADDAPATEDYDPHYEPVVPLPDAIVVSTGEEEETQLFIERAKLFRFDVATKEWKERGVGQIKVLHHPVNNTYRLLLRREQVHKVVLNQLITPDLDMQPLATSDKAWCWIGYNYTDDENKLEKLAVRFKYQELALKFHEAVQTALAAIKEKQSSKIPSTVQNYEDVSGDEGAAGYGRDAEGESDGEDDEDVDDDDDEEDERSIMCRKHCSLSENRNGIWTEVYSGNIEIYFDQDMYGARISMEDEDESLVTNSIIGTNSKMTVENNTCVWKAVEWANGDNFFWRTLKATFDDEKAAEEFYMSFQEGVNYAQHIQLVDQIPVIEEADQAE